MEDHDTMRLVMLSLLVALATTIAVVMGSLVAY